MTTKLSTTRPRTLKAPDARHMAAKALLAQCWAVERQFAPTLPAEMPWSARDAGALGSFLKANPALTFAEIADMLRNRLKSEDHALGEPCFQWLPYLTRYAAGPLDRFKLPKRTPDGPTTPNRADDRIASTTIATEAALARVRGMAGGRDQQPRGLCAPDGSAGYAGRDRGADGA